MRLVCLAVAVLASLTFADDMAPARPLTPADAAALEEPTALGRRVLAALSRYLELMPASIQFAEDNTLLTRMPTVEVLHATRCLSDADWALCRRYLATLHPLPAASVGPQPLLSMQTARGVLVFQTSGDVVISAES